ncbi:MAG: hypothetical protein ACK5Z5_06955 [Neisseriaceae bacterium]
MINVLTGLRKYNDNKNVKSKTNIFIIKSNKLCNDKLFSLIFENAEKYIIQPIAAHAA